MPTARLPTEVVRPSYVPAACFGGWFARHVWPHPGLMLVWMVGWPLLLGLAAGLALAGMIANPVIGLFLAIVAAAQLQQLRRYGPRALLALRAG